MSSTVYLREYINNRLTAAAAEIFGAIKNIIVEYEEEIDRQRGLLDVVRKPEIKLHRIEFPLQHVCKEKVPSNQQFCNQERNVTVDQEDPEPPQMKEEQDELCISHGEEQLVVKQETDGSILTPTHEENDHSDDETLRAAQKEFADNMVFISSILEAPTGDLLLSDNSHVAESLDQTGDTFDRNYNLKSEIHFKINPSERPYMCQICGKDLKTRRAFYDHMRIHSGERPYICKTCGEGFRRRYEMTIHIRRAHTGEKPHLCKICGKRFTVAKSLKVHMRIHTDERPYNCETCGKDFRRHHHLAVHRQSVHSGERPHICKVCGKGFAIRNSLIVHTRIHTGERPYSCGTCGKDFQRRCDLTLHTRTVHNSEGPCNNVETCRNQVQSEK